MTCNHYRICFLVERNIYIYIYPRGRRFTGNSCPKGVYIYEVGVGLGWGGVGMVTFIELAHMVGATQHHVPCTCTHGRCYASHGMGWGLGWGGVGMVTFIELAHMVGATQHHVPCTCTHGRCYASHGMGWGGDGNVH